MQKSKHLYIVGCRSCGASITQDLDEPVTVCPHCGSELTAEPITFDSAFKEREAARRAQMACSREQEMLAAKARRKARKNRALLIAAVIGALCVLLGIAFDGTRLATGLFAAGGIILCCAAWALFTGVFGEQNKMLGKNDTAWWTSWRR